MRDEPIVRFIPPLVLIPLSMLLLFFNPVNAIYDCDVVGGHGDPCPPIGVISISFGVLPLVLLVIALGWLIRDS